jgi:hypothetical protein
MLKHVKNDRDSGRLKTLKMIETRTNNCEAVARDVKNIREKGRQAPVQWETLISYRHDRL